MNIDKTRAKETARRILKGEYRPWFTETEKRAGDVVISGWVKVA